mmetsp:Transcript_40307/g.29717  ORF Transcript_40307/g.29717 Transcript_40307/m.29717 type:complete len:117 (+) Transcript_40307:6-356(+)
MSLLLLSLLMISVSKGSHYNIIAMDGGGMKGLVSAVALDYMEQYAYNYSREMGYDQYDKPREEPKFHLSELFHLISGTSTGSLIAAGLVMPNEDGEHKYYASDLVRLFEVQGAEVF